MRVWSALVGLIFAWPEAGPAQVRLEIIPNPVDVVLSEGPALSLIHI